MPLRRNAIKHHGMSKTGRETMRAKYKVEMDGMVRVEIRGVYLGSYPSRAEAVRGARLFRELARRSARE